MVGTAVIFVLGEQALSRAVHQDKEEQVWRNRFGGTVCVSTGYLSGLWFELCALSWHVLKSIRVQGPVLVIWREDTAPCGVLSLAENTTQGFDFLLPS